MNYLFPETMRLGLIGAALLVNLPMVGGAMADPADTAPFAEKASAAVVPASASVDADTTEILTRSARAPQRAATASASAQAAYELNEQGVQLIFDGKKDEGKQKILEALKQDPLSTTALYNYAGICLTEDKPDEAVSAMKKAVGVDPNDLALVNRLAEAHFANSDLKGAVEAYERIAKVDPKHDQALYRLGTLYGMQQRWQDAEVALKRALEFNKDDPRVLSNLGSVLVVLKKYADAVSILKRAQDLKPNAETEMSLAIAYEGLKDEKSALSHYESARKQGVDDPNIDTRIKELKAKLGL